MAAAFVRWTFCRAVLHRGWWLVVAAVGVVGLAVAPEEIRFL